MKYYSTVVNRLFDTEQELLRAEKQIADEKAAKEAKEKKLKEQRVTRAKEVEAALKEADEAKERANNLLNDFVKDYGYFHTTYTTKRNSNNAADDFINKLFSFLGETK